MDEVGRNISVEYVCPGAGGSALQVHCSQCESLGRGIFRSVVILIKRRVVIEIVDG